MEAPPILCLKAHGGVIQAIPDVFQTSVGDPKHSKVVRARNTAACWFRRGNVFRSCGRGAHLLDVRFVKGCRVEDSGELTVPLGRPGAILHRSRPQRVKAWWDESQGARLVRPLVRLIIVGCRASKCGFSDVQTAGRRYSLCITTKVAISGCFANCYEDSVTAHSATAGVYSAAQRAVYHT